ncbi:MULTISPECIES: glycosyltransferase family 2 protein [Rhodomicrobium]|uniref:glycosyltransferase family 2 protein n=1 Tax=Rhodomicrobium TaxID=1068 RepID=UPI000B4A86A7|nr:MULTISPECIES: glycosyltransferase family 2 protein [Rhodomicrobium]
MSADAKPFVAIIMPALNEEGYIEAAIASVTPEDDGGIDYELLVMDGGSTDRTAEIVERLGEENGRIKLLANPRKIQSAAMNIAARDASPQAQYLLRADCHSHYPEGFAERCVAALREKGAASVVVTMRSVGRGCLQKAIAAASNSRLGNGGSAHRRAGASCYVDHGHHAAFDREAYLALGGYDESFRHNEDAEYDQRVLRSGRRIWLIGDLAIDYFPRADFSALGRQYRNYGWGRANTLMKHRAIPRPRQILPVVIFVGNAGALLLAPLVPEFLLVPLLYAGLCCGWGLALALKAGNVCTALSGPAAMVMHLSWAYGFLWRLLLPPATEAGGLRNRPGPAPG